MLLSPSSDGVENVPWYDDDPGRAYDHVMGLVWNFWDTMRTDPNGLPYYAEHSPLPFKVNALTGEVGQLRNNNGDGTVVGASTYTSNWCPTLELLIELQRLDVDRADEYRRAFDLLLAWMKKYPIDNQRWGPFFEDVQGWSDTQINAITCAQFIMEHRDLFPDWKQDVERIFAWVYATLGNKDWGGRGAFDGAN
jgi:hypothetical protein